MLNNLILLLNLLPFITLIFYINTFNLITLWYLAGIYLITTGFYLLLEDADIFIGFLWVIDLGVGLIFFIFILHFSTFLYHKPNLDKPSRILNGNFFLLLMLMCLIYIFAEPTNNQNTLFLNKNFFFNIIWYDFYEFFFIQTITDLNVLKEIYFYQNSIEFFIINFVLLYGIISSVILCFLIKKIFTILNYTQFKNFKLKKTINSNFFLRNQNFIKQQNTLSGTRVWLKKRFLKSNDSKTDLNKRIW